MEAHLRPDSIPANNTRLNPGDVVAVLGNSGNSFGEHLHVEASINTSGLRPTEGQNIINFWWANVAERYADPENPQGTRFDPAPLFGLDE